MLTPAIRRWTLVLAALAAAALACARADVPIVPEKPVIVTPVALLVAASPTSEIAATTTQEAPAATATLEATTEPTATSEAPTATSVVQLPPTETPAVQNPLPTDTLAAPTETTVPTATGAAPPGQGIPANATFSQDFVISSESGIVVGVPDYLKDGRPETWASLRGGSTNWVLALPGPQTIAGLKFYAQKDGSDPTTLVKIEARLDGQDWATVYVGSGNCGVSNCDTLPQREFKDIGFAPVNAQFIRLTSGPTRFAFGEIQVAIVP